MEQHTLNDRPIVPEGALARLRSVYGGLSEAEQRVAHFIEQNPQETVHLSVQMLSQRIGVSEATIVRCCRSIGYQGLRDLKLALAGETANSLQLLHEDIVPDDSVQEITRKVLQSDIQAIADTLAMLDTLALEQAVRAISEATRIEFYGIGSSLPVVLDAYYRFLRIGLPATVITDAHMQSVSASQLPAGAVAFAVSHTGRSVETLDALRKARAANATCILLSSHAHTPLSQYAHIQLITAARETAFRQEAVTSRIAHLSVIDALYVAVAMRRFDTAMETLARSTNIVSEHMTP